MREFKVRVRCVDCGFSPVYVRCAVAEFTNNLGCKGMIFECYNDILDEDVKVEVALVDFWTLRELPSYIAPFHEISKSLEKLNLYCPKSI